MIRLLAFFFGCHHKVYSWPRKQGNETVVVCLQCGARIPYQIGKGKCSRWQSLTVACFLLLLVGCTPPKEQAKPTPVAPKSAPISEPVGAITFTNQDLVVISPRRLNYCEKQDQRKYAGTFNFDCWSNEEDRFVRLTLLEQ